MHKTKRVRVDGGGIKSSDDGDATVNESSEIKTILMALSGKMDTLNQTMDDIDQRLNTKIDHLEANMSNKICAIQSEMEQRFKSYSTEIDGRITNVITAANNNYETVNNATKALSKRVEEIRGFQELRLDNLERLSLLKDLIITGVPMEQGDNPCNIVRDICEVLSCNLRQGDFATIYRLRSKKAASTSKQIVPIIARLHEEWAKQVFLTAYFKKKNLNLMDIGFKSPNRIYVNENLTKLNREIFNLATFAKKSNLIYKYFTRHGLVFIQQNENSRVSCMRHINELQSILPSNFDKNQQINNTLPMQGSNASVSNVVPMSSNSSPVNGPC